MKKTVRPIQFKAIPIAVTYAVNDKIKHNRSFGVINLDLNVWYHFELWYNNHAAITKVYVE